MSNVEKIEIITDKLELACDHVEKHLGSLEDEDGNYTDVAQEIAGLLLPEMTSALAKLEGYIADNS